MKFGSFLVTALAFLSISLMGCQKSAKDAAQEGNAKVAEMNSLSQQLYNSHKIYIFTQPGTENAVRSVAYDYAWDTKTKPQLAEIKSQLNGIVSRGDDIFKTDRRKDVRISDPDGGLLRAKNNAIAYLASLEAYERTGKTKTLK